MKKRDIYFGLDLDETLVHTVKVWGLGDIPEDAEFYLYEEGKISYGVYLRDGLKDFLKTIDDQFNLFFYTRALGYYAKDIVKQLGYDHTPLFHRDHTHTVKYKEFGAYEREVEKVVFKKDLFKIADLLDTTINKIVFIDDVIDEKQITPIYCVIQIPEFENTLDSDLLIIKDHINYLQHIESDERFVECLRSLTFDSISIEKTPIPTIEKKRIKIKNC